MCAGVSVYEFQGWDGKGSRPRTRTLLTVHYLFLAQIKSLKILNLNLAFQVVIKQEKRRYFI